MPDDVRHAKQLLDHYLADEVLHDRPEHGVPVVDRDDDEVLISPGQPRPDPGAHDYTAVAVAFNVSGTRMSKSNAPHHIAE